MTGKQLIKNMQEENGQMIWSIVDLAKYIKKTNPKANYVYYPLDGSFTVSLDGNFTAPELQALAIALYNDRADAVPY